MPDTARTAAARAIARMLGGATLDSVLPPLQGSLADERERGLAGEISFGVARWYFQLAAIVDELVDRPVKDKLMLAVLLAGLYQLRFMRVPPHAAISESVNTVRRVGRPRGAGMVNAVLRRYQRETDKIDEKLAGTAATRHAYPQWLVDRLAADWPEATGLLQAGNERPPMWLRVNRRRSDIDSWCAAFVDQHDAEPQRSQWAADAVALPQPLPVEQIPGFTAGEVSVQDAGAQLAATMLDLRDGMRVLDACAAPGGKTCHILESADVQVTAVDHDERRLGKVQQNLERLGLEASVTVGDAAMPEQWWDGRPFDRILLDVPCSATGVIRRHPDIKLLRRAGDIDAFAARQLAMLVATWPLLAPGGRLLYATCSLLAAENSRVVEAFMARESGAQTRVLTPGCGLAGGFGVQILTGEAGMDGFYYSCLEAA
ncbi:MAG: 16S rRNA (cytosine(967)-C(5))-methyltransferase RsmB [Gammaproteobacteria bacterium]|nr:16S rRNA (cytosine(967)-C(5))-methyltransferase RsmB [Gammaproteobacteria bacterium]NNF60349.1 16S rRNA (cytosine(967)-C(5))-methyltransferase RsmB [Gammaproteobacteria bacterium]NNM20607.1 16S rRNA (cytosine(967)-C(5))-methyltransferase RsmB [Gammaproteobacteria bacterium]